MKSLHSITFAAIVALAVSCSSRPDAAEFLQPVVSECEVVLDGYKATFSCLVQGNAHITASGFALSTDGGMETRVGAVLSGGKMSLEFSGLSPETEYSVRAYVSNGRNEMFGPETTFLVEEIEPVVNVPDPVFKEYLLANFDENNDGQLSELEVEGITDIEVCTDNIRSLEGIEHFKNLRNLAAQGTDTQNDRRNGLLRNVDLSANDHLRSIGLDFNNIEQLSLPKNAIRLERISCSMNRLESLDLSSCSKLTELYCWKNNLTVLDVTHCPELENLQCAQNDFYENGLDVSSNPKLRYLWCNDAELQSIDVSSNTELVEFGCGGNSIKSLDVSKNTNLVILECGCCRISSIKISSLPNLEELSIGDDDIREPLDMSMFPNLRRYDGNNLPLSRMPDFSRNPLLTSMHICTTGGAYYMDEDFFCDWPDIVSFNIAGYQGTDIDLSLNTKMEELWLQDIPNVTVFDLSASPALKYICLNRDGKLEKVYVHKDVDISKLTVEKTEDVTAVIEHRGQ